MNITFSFIVKLVNTLSILDDSCDSITYIILPYIT